MKNWRTWLIVMLAIAVIILSWISCNATKEAVDVPDTKGSVDSLLLVKRADSLKLVWQRDSIRLEKEWTEFEKTALTNKMLSDESQIRYLGGVIKALRKDSSITILDISCDSLSDVALRLADSNDSLRTLQVKMDQLMRYEIAIRDTAIEDLDRGQSAALDAALKSAAAFDKYRKQNKPANQVYIGLSGLYNPLTFGAGGSLMLKTKKDKLFGATYYITNGKPVYEARMLYKLRLRK